MKFLRSFTGQLIVGSVITVLAIFSFSIYSFLNIEEISVIEIDVTKVIQKIPFILFSIQSESLRQANLISSFYHRFISYDAFSAQIKETEKREDEQFMKIKELQKLSENMIFLNKEEKEFSERFGRTVDAVNIRSAKTKRARSASAVFLFNEKVGCATCDTCFC